MAELDWSFADLEEEIDDDSWLRRVRGSPAPPPVQRGLEERMPESDDLSLRGVPRGEPDVDTAGDSDEQELREVTGDLGGAAAGADSGEAERGQFPVSPPPATASPPGPPRRPDTPCPAARAGPAPAVQGQPFSLFVPLNPAARAPPAPPPRSAAPGNAGANASATGARAVPPAAGAPGETCGICGSGGPLDESTLGGWYCQQCWAGYDGPGRRIPKQCAQCRGPPPLAESTGGGHYCGGCWAAYDGKCTPVGGQAPPAPPAPRPPPPPQPPQPPRLWGIAYMVSTAGAKYDAGALEPLLCERRCLLCARCRGWLDAVPTVETWHWVRGRKVFCPYARPGPGHLRAHITPPVKPAPPKAAAGPRAVQWAADPARLGPRPTAPRVPREIALAVSGPRALDLAPPPPTSAGAAAAVSPGVELPAVRALAAGGIAGGGAVCRRRDTGPEPRPLPQLTPQTHDGGTINMRVVPSAAGQPSPRSEPSGDHGDVCKSFLWHAIGLSYGEQRGRKMLEAELHSFWDRARGELRVLHLDAQRAHLHRMSELVDDLIAGTADGGSPAASHTRLSAAPRAAVPPKCPPHPDSWPPPPAYGWWVPPAVRYKRGTPLPYLLERPAWAR
eukprot:TRINITY_DN16341_c2_g2_i1.p1 TRINITY_DN16341_c2_g2~~TRINITY_DN16341_c2_g2_i1.p1  ORF type:complete len:641 (+),score=92.44 TRINITY_DN16341_c2_g2_i1:78-1925(+)